MPLQRMRSGSRLLLLLALAVPGQMAAQTTGDIKGSVVDSAGAPLPGVSVEARSPALQASRTATTNANGDFRLPVLPPGVYSVSARLEGFESEEQSGIRVPLGETVTLPRFTLLVVMKAETVVSGEVPLVDTASTRIGTSIPAFTLSQLPLGRNYSSAMLTLAGSGKDYARCNCDPSRTAGNPMFGTTSLESNFIIDGLNTTGVRDGDQGKQLNLEFVQEVEVRSGGYEAEFGKAMGASVNVVTKSGGNDFHGDVFGYYDSSSLAASDQHAAERNALNLALPGSPKQYDVGLDLGGYFLKDTLWFFGAYDRVASDTDYQRVDSLTYTPTSVVSNYIGGTDVRRANLYSAKLTLRAGPSHTFVASVFGDPNTYDGRNALAAGPASAALIRAEYGGTDVVARWNGLFGEGLLAQASYGYHEESNTKSSDFADRVLFYDHRRGYGQAALGSGPGGGLGPGTLRRNSWGATATAFLGDHELKGGVGYELQNSSQTTYWSGGGEVNRWLSSSDGSLRYARHDGYTKSPLNCQVRTDGSTGNFGFVDPTTCNGWEMAAAQDASPRSQNLAFFLQDSWRILPNLTLNAGVRYEDQRIYDAQNQPTIKLTDQWSPRIGVVWDPLANGRSKVYASYSRYYQVIPQNIQLNAVSAQPFVYVFNYTGDRLDFVNELGAFAYPSGSAYVPPGVKGYRQDEYVAGVEAEVFRNWSVGIKGIYRSLGSLLEDRCDLYDPRSGLAGSVPPGVFGTCAMMNPGQGQFGQISDPTNPDCWEDYPASTIPKPCESVRGSRVFRALQLDVKRRLSDQFQLQASYLYSRLVGNYDGFVNQLYGAAYPNLSPDFDYPETVVNSWGKLSLDRTHQVKLTGFYAFPFGLRTGLNATFATGGPLSIVGVASNGYRIYLESRGSWDQLPSTYSVDLHVEYSFRFGSVALTPLLDIFNLTDAQPAVARGQLYNNTIGGNQSPPYTSPSVATFGQNTIWQAPRLIRLGARVTF